MITSIYYYGYYKPYMINNAGSKKTQAITPSKLSMATAPETKQSVLLNKAFKNDVVSYARNLSKNVVSLKDTARVFLDDAEMLEVNVRTEGFETVKEWAEEDLENYVTAYNSANAFAVEQEHSPAMKEFANQMATYAEENENLLNEVGIRHEDGRLVFHNEKIESMNYKTFKEEVKKATEFFKGSYEKTSDLLSHPLARHMNFRSLGYYYNYKMGTVQDDTFKLIEAGLIVDMAI